MAKHPHEEKPPLPYRVGATITAQPWHPPPGQDIKYGDYYAQDELREELQEEHPVDICLRYTEATEASNEGEHVELQVVDQIVVVDGTHCQTTKVKVVDHRSAHERLRSPMPCGDEAITAKFFDPLYHDIEDERSDMFRNTYYRCHAETCVYRQLKPLWGTVVPRFYGSFKALIPVSGRQGRSRYVYTILYDYVPGVELTRIDPEEWSQPERKAIMKAIIDGDSKIRQAGVDQGDLMPRNVLVNGEPGNLISVHIIDFDHAEFEFDFDPDEDELEPEAPSEIVDRWTHKLRCPADYFSELVDWPWDDWVREMYLR